MRLDATYNEAALLALGAKRITEVRDEHHKLVGFDVLPEELDVSGHDAKVKDLKANPPAPHEPPLSQEELIAVRKLLRASAI